MIEFNRQTLIKILNAYGETTYLEHAETISESDTRKIGKLASKYIGKYNLVDRTIIAGVIEFHEGQEREPRLKRRNMKAYQELSAFKPISPNKGIIKRLTEYFKRGANKA